MIVFSTSSALQDHLLQQAGPETLVIVPHQRLAHQLWQRQRAAALARGRRAWEPLNLATLKTWWNRLFRSLWPEQALAPTLTRWTFWQRLLQAGPLPEGIAPDLSWVRALDETQLLLSRHQLPLAAPAGEDTPLVAWRRRISREFQDLLQEEGWLSPGDLPGYLLKALQSDRLSLAKKILVVGLESPAPVEDTWLKAAARHTSLSHLRLEGHPRAVQAALALPDPQQEMEWVATQLAEAAHDRGLPWHRLAVTSPAMETYAPGLQRVLRELLGPPQADGGWAYNFSQGPTLADTPLWAAALLPLAFHTRGQRREELVSLLLSPFYHRFHSQQERLARWDRLFREGRADRGWGRLRRVMAEAAGSQPNLQEVLARLDRLVAALPSGRALGRDWVQGLQQAWQEGGFPGGLREEETVQRQRLLELLTEVAGALGAEHLEPGEFQEWLAQAARQVELPGPGVQEAGVQVMGLLEMRGLDFSRVYCLGMNSGVFPAPPRPLPLLSPRERREVLGGTPLSQQRFARELYDQLLAAAPNLTLTRPQLQNDEEQVATALHEGPWEERQISILGRPHPAWLRSPAVRAAFEAPPETSPREEPAVLLTVPSSLSISQVQTALECPCRFLLEGQLGLRELPEVESGLSAQERGTMLHRVLARFTGDFLEELRQAGDWDDERARELLRRTVEGLLQPLAGDLHWRAERDRWLGEAEESPGLLWQWLAREQERFHQGWRWRGIEVAFEDLQGPGWPCVLRGRIDRLDCHDDACQLLVWDYKSGEIPSKRDVLEACEEFQVAGYLLALKQGRLAKLPDLPRHSARGGYIGLKSTRAEHLKHQDFKAAAADWDRVLAEWEERLADLGRRLAAGDYTPEPCPAPEGRDLGACQYCPFPLVCGFIAPSPEADDEDEEL